MKRSLAPVLGVFILFSFDGGVANGQCTTTNATSCACQTSGATDCDLLPDLMISWQALESSYGGPSEYTQSSTSNPGRLRITGATPNVGHGPLEVRGVDANGDRRFICGTDTFVYHNLSSNEGFTCPAPWAGLTPRQILYQRIYHKNGNAMTFNDVQRGTMTYHAGHGHYHIDGWSNFDLRLAQPGSTNPLDWPIVATGGKLGYCLINLFTCSGSPGYCRTSHLYNQGTILDNSTFGSNYALGDHWTSCGDDAQGIDVGKGDIYDEGLQGMWINLMPGMCNGQYYIVSRVDPNNDFLEENDNNNWTSIPFTIALQNAAGTGTSAAIGCSGRLVMAPGETRTLTASPGTAYNWSTGATSQSITVSSPGTYSCTVTCPCGSLSTPTVTLTTISAPAAPVGTGATLFAPGTADLSATGTNVRWYDAASGGNQVGTGNAFTTPFITTTTDYWAEDRTISPGTDLNVGKSNNSGTGAYGNTRQWLYFDATQPFKLVSFKVYANSLGLRHFVLVDRNGDLIAEKYIEIPSGLNTITVNWDVPMGTHHQITCYDEGATSSGTEVQVIDLWYNTASVTFPYAIGTMGSITGSSTGTNYYYLYDWVVHSDAVEAVGPRTMVTATVTNPLLLPLKMKLEGPFVSGTGMMNDALRTGGLIPTTEPYTGLGFAQPPGNGGETASPVVFTVTGNDAIVDWVRVEVRSSSDPGAVLATKQALLQRDGDVVAVDGVSTLSVDLLPGNYHIAVRHRNHLGCMTAAPVALSAATPLTDFTLASTATWGTNARKDIGGVMVLWAGNSRQDVELKYTGSDNDREPVLQAIGGVVPTNTVSGYSNTDNTMDGVTKYTGTGNDRDPILSNIGGTVPTNTRTEQLP